MSPAAYVAVGAVRVYQWTVRPLIGANCRFYPSCSEYAVEAFREHGALRGGALAGWRILRCNPWCTCGYDPVPPRKAAGSANRLAASVPEAAWFNDQAPPDGPDPAGATGGNDYGKSY